MVKPTLKRLSLSKLEWARNLHNDPDVLKMLTDPRVVSKEEQLQWFENLRKSKSSQRLVASMMSVPIGVVRVDQIDRHNKSVCIGLDIHKDHRGKGYAKLIYREILKYWFEKEKFNRVWLYVASYNTVARKLYKSLGFLEENIQREALYKNGTYYDYIGMSFLASYWSELTSPKTCTRCQKTKDPDEFYRLYRKGGYRVKLRSQCRSCLYEKYKLLYEEKNRESRRKQARKNHLLKKYGLTVEQYQEMLTRQEFVCAICKEPEIYVRVKGLKPILSVDHCHSTGKVRGLLCQQCNVGLGKFKDNPDSLEAAVNYLKESKDDQ